MSGRECLVFAAKRRRAGWLLPFLDARPPEATRVRRARSPRLPAHLARKTSEAPSRRPRRSSAHRKATRRSSRRWHTSNEQPRSRAFRSPRRRPRPRTAPAIPRPARARCATSSSCDPTSSTSTPPTAPPSERCAPPPPRRPVREFSIFFASRGGNTCAQIDDRLARWIFFLPLAPAKDDAPPNLRLSKRPFPIDAHSR